LANQVDIESGANRSAASGTPGFDHFLFSQESSIRRAAGWNLMMSQKSRVRRLIENLPQRLYQDSETPQ
jgi:hypothetical protein